MFSLFNVLDIKHVQNQIICSDKHIRLSRTRIPQRTMWRRARCSNVDRISTDNLSLSDDCCNSLTVRFTADGFLLDRRSLVLLEECEAWTLHRTSPGSHSTGSVQECRLSNNCKCLKRFKIHCDQNKSVDETMRGVKPEERWHPDSDWRKLGPATGSEVSE